MKMLNVSVQPWPSCKAEKLVSERSANTSLGTYLLHLYLYSQTACRSTQKVFFSWPP